MGFIYDDNIINNNTQFCVNTGGIRQPHRQPQHLPHQQQQQLPQQHQQQQQLPQQHQQQQQLPHIQHQPHPQHHHQQVSTIKIEINQFEIFSCEPTSHVDDCTIFTFRLASQSCVLLTDDHQSKLLTSLVPCFYSELNNTSFDSLSISDISLKYGGDTYTLHDFCPPYEITKTGKKIKIPLVKKNSVKCSSDLTLLIWGCSKNNKNSNLKTLYINGIIIDETNKQPLEESSSDVSMWNDAKLIVSTDKPISSTNSSSQCQSHADW
jgi:hypothetical protein